MSVYECLVNYLKENGVITNLKAFSCEHNMDYRWARAMARRVEQNHPEVFLLRFPGRGRPICLRWMERPN